MRLALTHSGQHFAPKRHARYTPMPATPPGVSFLCFERTRTVKTLRYRSGEKPHVLRFGNPTCCLTPSLNLLSQAVPYRHPAATLPADETQSACYLVCALLVWR